MSTSQEIRDAADAVVAANAAVESARPPFLAAFNAAQQAANASPEAAALESAQSSFDAVFATEMANGNVNALGAVLDAANSDRATAIAALTTAIAEYDGQ